MAKSRKSNESLLSRLSSESELVCVLCCENIELYAVGPCEHPVCFKCSARMRVIAKQTYCAVCRSEIDQVIFSSSRKPFKSFQINDLLLNKRFGIRFETADVERSFENLLDYACSECSEVLESLHALKKHVRQVHDKSYCAICLDNLTIFPREFKAYSKKDIVIHRREGNSGAENGHSYVGTGHPCCRFCDDRFFDNDALLFHLRRNHFWCHFCENDGKQDYYNVYKDLRNHFAQEHWLCDEGECRHEKFTSVFRSKLDFQAHVLSAHSKGLSKHQRKEAGKVELGFNYGLQRQQKGAVSGRDYEEMKDDAGAPHHGRERKPDHGHVGVSSADASSTSQIRRDRDVVDVDKADGAAGERKSRRHEAEDVKDRKSLKSTMATSAVRCTSEPDLQKRFGGDSEDGVIGLLTHINKDEVPAVRGSPVARKKANDAPASQKELCDPPPCGMEPPLQASSLVQPPPVVKKVTESGSYCAPAVNGDTSSGVEKAMEMDFPPPASTGALKRPDIAQAPCPVPSNILIPPGRSLRSDEDFPSLVVGTKSDKPLISSWNNPSSDVKSKPGKSAKKGKSYSQQSGRGKLAREDFPALGNDAAAVGAGDSVVACTAATSGPTFSALASHGSGVTRPPGLSKPMPGPNASPAIDQPPPGLARTRAAVGQAPPGLVKEREQASDSSKAERNLQLLTILQTCLDELSMTTFKTLSGEFRRGLKTPQEYYACISDLLGDNLKLVFSELVALLPDDAKQAELLRVHKDSEIKRKHLQELTMSAPKPDYSQPAPWGVPAASRKKAAAKAHVLPHGQTQSQCQHCGETFPTEKAIEHMELHKETSFPSLPVAVQKKRNNNFVPFRTPRELPVRNAWGK